MAITRHESSKINCKAVEANGFVYTSGIVADNLADEVMGQTRQILAEIDRLLALCGTDKSRIVQATVWLSHIKARDDMNKVWIDWTQGRDLPARACVESALADPRMLVEIAVVAVK